MRLWIERLGAKEYQVGLREDGVEGGRVAHSGGIEHRGEAHALDSSKEVGDEVGLEQGLAAGTRDAPVVFF